MASPALAVEVVDTLHAVLGATWVTGVGETLIDVALTPLPDEARWAGAGVAAHLVHTGAIVEALGASGGGVQGRMAVINIDLTVYTLCASGAGALVGVGQIDAGTPVLAGLGQTLVDLLGAVRPMVASHTLAGKAAKVVSAGSPVLAGVGRALVHLVLTVAARVACLAVAVMLVFLIHTEPSVLAQESDIDASLLCSHLAGHAEHVAVEASPAAAALAVVLRVGLPARATVLAGSRVAPVHKVLAVEASVALWAGTLIGAIAVLAGAAMQTGP